MTETFYEVSVWNTETQGRVMQFTRQPARTMHELEEFFDAPDLDIKIDREWSEEITPINPVTQ